MYDIIGEFSSDYDSIDEGTYISDLTKYINCYCMDKFTEEEAADIIEETYNDPIAYLHQNYPDLFAYTDLTPHKWLQILLMKRLTDTFDLDIVCNQTYVEFTNRV
jgi:hypothetical protein